MLTSALVFPVGAGAVPAPLSQVGSVGSNAGQLSAPLGVAVNGSGNLFVGDQGNNRIDEFTAAGAFVRAFGWDVVSGAPTTFEVCTTSCKEGLAGGGAGELNGPVGLAFDGSGNLYVADRSNRRIDVFDPATPSFLRAFGWDVVSGAPTTFEVCTTSCKEGLAGGGAGQLNGPTDVAFDGSGNLYVADRNNDRISEFNVGVPSFTLAFGGGVASGGTSFQVCTTSCLSGEPGSGAGQLNGPFGLTLDGAGNLFVADSQNHRISEFNANAPSFTQAVGWGVFNGGSAPQSCTSVCMIGSSGGGSGQFKIPQDVAVTAPTST